LIGDAVMNRVPFSPGDTDAVVAFCLAHAAGEQDAALLRQLMLELTSDPAGVLVIADGGAIALVATVIDRVRNGADAANIEVLGVRAAPAAAAFVEHVVEPAVAFARAGERRALQIALPAALGAVDGLADALGAVGFARAYDTFEMRRPASVWESEAAAVPAQVDVAPLPGGWSWTDIDVARAEAAYAALGEMFRDAPATNLIPLEDFRQRVASGAARWRALLDGERIAGLVRVVPHGAEGEVRILGRVPAYRGQGLGPRLLSEGLRLLRAAAAGDVMLHVEAANDRALDLYRRFGFEVVTRTPVFARPLRG
jgi:ribosomal protein S18 acetylase RimI-like enzyme